MSAVFLHIMHHPSFFAGVTPATKNTLEFYVSVHCHLVSSEIVSSGEPLATMTCEGHIDILCLYKESK